MCYYDVLIGLIGLRTLVIGDLLLDLIHDLFEAGLMKSSLGIESVHVL